MEPSVSEENQTSTEVIVETPEVKSDTKPRTQLKNKEQVRDFLIHSITKNKAEIANFLFDKCSPVLDEIFADNDSKLHQALVYASSKGYTDIVNLILDMGEGKLKFESLDAAIDASNSEGQTSVKNLLFDKVSLDKSGYEKLMFSRIEKGDLDAVKTLFDKQK